LLDAHDRVAVLRTLSKAHALAGARVGTLLAAPAVIGLLRRIIAPYPLPAASVAAALAATTAAGVVQAQARIATAREQREQLQRALVSLPDVLEILPSAANFLCVRWRDASTVYATLLRAGVVVRDVTRYRGLDGCLRITVGTPEENRLLLAALSRREEAA
jgi:histidinol-phosphate aminotransferase